MEKKQCLAKYFWQVTYAHTIAYFIAGLIVLPIMNYGDLWAKDIISSFMRPIDDPIIGLGPLLQIFRGLLVALIILPLRKTFFEEKNGLLKLGLMILGFSVLSTFAAALGSFEGYIYTKVPAKYQALGYPEAIIWLSLFIGILHISIKYGHKKIITILPIIFMILICLMSIMGYFAAI